MLSVKSKLEVEMPKKVVGTIIEIVKVSGAVILTMGIAAFVLLLYQVYLEPRTSVIVGAVIGLFVTGLLESDRGHLEFLDIRDFLLAALGLVLIFITVLAIPTVGYSLIGLVLGWQIGIAVFVFTWISSGLPLVVLYVVQLVKWVVIPVLLRRPLTNR